MQGFPLIPEFLQNQSEDSLGDLLVGSFYSFEDLLVAQEVNSHLNFLREKRLEFGLFFSHPSLVLEQVLNGVALLRLDQTLPDLLMISLQIRVKVRVVFLINSDWLFTHIHPLC